MFKNMVKIETFKVTERIELQSVTYFFMGIRKYERPIGDHKQTIVGR